MNTDFLTANSALLGVRDRTGQNYFDLNSLADIKGNGDLQGADEKRVALEKVGGQFESMLLQEMLSSMRRANDILFEDSFFSSEQVKFYQEMFDQQLTLEMGASGTLGIADQFVRNVSNELLPAEKLSNQFDLNNGMPLDAGDFDQAIMNPLYQVYEEKEKSRLKTALDADSDSLAIAPVKATITPEAVITEPPTEGKESGGQQFLQTILPFAADVAERLGIKVSELMAQAVLETGWGKKIIHSDSGENSFNLFGIKANGGWQGETANTVTTEFIGGQAIKISADFRKYGSFKESFDDFFQFVSSQPRYAKVLEAGADKFYSALQSAGYATDPSYAEKISDIAGRIEQMFFGDKAQKPF